MKIAFFRLEDWQRKHVQSSEMLKDHELVFIEDILNKDNIPEHTDFEVASIFVNSEVSDGVLAMFPKLKLIATRSTGYDHIDLAACKRRGIAVANVPAYGENTVAEFTFALLLNLSRKINESYNRVREEGSFDLKDLRGFDLKGKILGVVGTGKIGKNVIKIANGFGMKILAHDVFPDKEASQKLNFQYVPLPELLKTSDIITFHVPYMKETHHLINKNNFKNIKKGAYLINTSRGGVIETEALIEALKSGHLAGAGLDVLEEEGVIKDELSFLVSGHPEEHNLKTILAGHVLIDMSNVIVTPHNAFNTREALERILDTTLDNIQGFSTDSPINIIRD